MRKKKKRTIFPTIVIVLLFIFIGNFVYSYKAEPFNGQGESFWMDGIRELLQKQNRVNLLVFGVDAVDKDSSARGRADTIMLLSIDFKSKEAALLSIPRDTRTTITGRRSQEKINHAHAYGGADLLVETVENLLNIDIQYYVRVNYGVVEEVVDALGGVKIDVPMDMKYSDPYDTPPLHINIPKGEQVLDGKNAVHFLRFRKGYANQDLGRIQAQQQFVKALVDELLSPSGIIKIPKLASIFYSNVDTNLNKSRVLSFATKGARIKSENITKLTLPGTPKMIGGGAYFVTDEKEFDTIRTQYFIGNAVSSDQVPEVSVLNGCGVRGIATKYANLVEEMGIPVGEIDNFESSEVQVSYIVYSKENKKVAQQIAKSLGIQKLEVKKDAQGESHITIVIGADLNQ